MKFYDRFRLTVTICSLSRWEIIPFWSLDPVEGYREIFWLCFRVNFVDFSLPK